MRVLLALSLLAVGLLAATAGATSLATRDVRLTDSALSPVEARIAVNDSVRWRNDGSKLHKVASDTSAWPSFSLRPQKSKSVRFAKAGCYRYKVDGKISGRVAVSASCAGTGTGPPPPPSTGATIYRYDITVIGDAHTVQRHSGDTSSTTTNGTVDVELVWKSTYRNVAFKKTVVGADLFTIVPAGSLFARGTTDITFTYNHARQEPWGPCQGNFSMKALASHTSLVGSRAPPLGNTFAFSSQMLLAPAQTISKRIDSACPEYSDEPRWIEFQGSPEPDIVRGGLTWADVSTPITLVTVSAERKSARIFSPLDRLSQGNGFTFQTGPVRNQGPCHYGAIAPVCTETFKGSLVVKFVPRRP
jgi:plastocyanin